MPEHPTALPAQAAHAYPARALSVAGGANIGDPIAAAELVEPGDVYRLAGDARPVRLMLRPADCGRAQVLAEGTGVGRAGDRIALLSLLTLMSPDGDRVEVLVVRHEAT